MPRAQAQVQVILERIPTVRQSLAELNDTLYQLGQVRDSLTIHTLPFIRKPYFQTRSSTEPDYKLRLEEEERRIRDLRAKLAKLTNKVRQSVFYFNEHDLIYPLSPARGTHQSKEISP
jgi:chaperonin cofactor prefoldin